MTYCGERTLVKMDGPSRVGLSVRCRSWLCPDCAPGRRRRLIAEFHGGKPDTFLTLTSRRVAGADPNKAALSLSHAWRTVRLRAIREARRNISRRKTPRGKAPPLGWPRDSMGRVPRQVQLISSKLPAGVVIEAHKSGWPHLHVLVRSRWIAHAWLSAQFDQLLGSPVVGVERITTRSKLNAYVAKYCSDAAHKFGNCKRYWFSRDYNLRPARPDRPRDRPGEGWEAWPVTLARWIEQVIALGYSVERPSVWKAIARPPP